jgi:hypothetical protein
MGKGKSQDGNVERKAHPIIVLFIMILLLNVVFNPTVVAENSAA